MLLLSFLAKCYRSECTVINTFLAIELETAVSILFTNRSTGGPHNEREI